MKKILFALLFLISFTVFPQSSTSSINTRITDSITTNNGRQITGAILNRLLKDMNGSYVNKTTDPYIKGATTPLSVTSNTVSISQATTATDGYLNSTDWNTFNNKGTGTVTTVTVTPNAGVSATVATYSTTPVMTFTLGAITPSSVVTPSVTANVGTFTTVTTSTVSTGYYNASASPTHFIGNQLDFDMANIRAYSDIAHHNDFVWKNSAGSVLYGGMVRGKLYLGDTTAVTSARLVVTDTTKGFLPNRWTTTQRDAISSPTNGLMGYNTTTHAFNGYQNGAWAAIGANSFTDGGAYTYLTSTTDLFQVGSSSSLGASLGVKGQGATSATYNQRNYNSSGTLLYELNDAGSASFTSSSTNPLTANGTGNTNIACNSSNSANSNFVLQKAGTDLWNLQNLASDNSFNIYSHALGVSKMTFLAGGNIGINNTAPAVGLDITAITSITGTGNVITANGTGNMTITSNSSNGSNSSFLLQRSGVDMWYIQSRGTGGKFVLYNATTTAEPFSVSATDNVTVGIASLATTATAGFPYIPTCAGVPTGVPTAITGFAPLVIDSTNNKMYFYSGGAWVILN